MAAIPSGDGIAWESDVDVDRQLGLSYQYINHVAKAVQKRSDKEHKAYADDTVGGEHIPGGCAVVLQGDGSADISAAVDLTVEQMVGGGLAWSKTGYLWCCTANASDPTKIKLDPHSVCAGSDMTWTGVHQFDSSATFCNPVDMTAIFIDGSVDISGAVSVDGTVNFNDLVDVSNLHAAGDVSVDGAFVAGGAVTGTDGAFTIFGATQTTDSTAGTLVKATVYLTTTDGFLEVYAALDAGNEFIIYADAANPPTTVRAEERSASGGEYGSSSIPIKNGYYWSITSDVVPTVSWIPIGSGACVKQ